METLIITGDALRSWEVLDDLAEFFGDNGADPDGNAWLPREPVSHEEAQPILKAGLGRMVNAAFLRDEEVIEMFKAGHVIYGEGEDEEPDWEALKNLVDDEALWAHYGAYGAGDSIWVIARK